MQIEPNDLLLIIDVQNDFCPGGALAVADGDAVVPVINRLIERFGHVVLTQDWHPSSHSSFASSHPGAAPFETIAMPYGPKRCGRIIACRGRRAPPSIRSSRPKGRAGDPERFSVRDRFLFRLYENDRSTPTGLTGYLRERGLKRIFMAGLRPILRLLFRAGRAPPRLLIPWSSNPAAGRSIWRARWRRPLLKWPRPACR